MKLIQLTEHNIRKSNLFSLSDKLLVGLSGGVDSVVLLHILLKLGYECVAVHCNFHLRGDESDRDELFVRSWCESIGVSLHVEQFDTIEYAERNNLSIEMAARELRYYLFDRLVAEMGLHRIAVAHHKDDNVETILINLIRGTGIRGLTGIKPINGLVVRPLLFASRDEIETYAAENGLPSVFDSTNAENLYVRNKIRNQIIPLLKQLNPSFSDSIIRSIENLEGCLSIYNHEIERLRQSIVSPCQDGYTLSISSIHNYVEPFTLLYELLSPYGFNRVVAQDIYRALDGEAGKIFESDQYRLEKGRTELILSPKKIQQEESFLLDISTPGFLDTSHFSIHWSVQDDLTVDAIKKTPQVAYVDADKLKTPIIVRRWKRGDFYFPTGMKGKKKISDWFANNKMNLSQKENTWVLCSNDQVVWIVGHRVDRRFVADEQSSGILLFEVRFP